MSLVRIQSGDSTFTMLPLSGLVRVFHQNLRIPLDSKDASLDVYYGIFFAYRFINTANSDILLMSHVFAYYTVEKQALLDTGITPILNHSISTWLQLHSRFYIYQRETPNKILQLTFHLSGKLNFLFCTTHILWSGTVNKQSKH